MGTVCTSPEMHPTQFHTQEPEEGIGLCTLPWFWLGNIVKAILV